MCRIDCAQQIPQADGVVKYTAAPRSVVRRLGQRRSVDRNDIFNIFPTKDGKIMHERKLDPSPHLSLGTMTFFTLATSAIRITLLVVISAALSGCFVSPWHGGTTPTPLDKAKPAPIERLIAFQQPHEGRTATLVVTRDRGALGGACYFALGINGTLAARLDIAESARFFLEPGKVKLRAGRDPFGTWLCSIGQDDWTETDIFLQSAETTFLRLSIDFYGLHLEESTPPRE